jgi:hydroxypyruvate reductase
LELALSTVRPLADVDNIALITLATDGEDGVTDAAGAVVTGETLARAHHLGLDPEEYLRKHDSYHFFQALDDLLLPGVTGTNTNDLCFLFTF